MTGLQMTFLSPPLASSISSLLLQKTDGERERGIEEREGERWFAQGGPVDSRCCLVVAALDEQSTIRSVLLLRNPLLLVRCDVLSKSGLVGGSSSLHSTLSPSTHTHAHSATRSTNLSLPSWTLSFELSKPLLGHTICCNKPAARSNAPETETDPKIQHPTQSFKTRPRRPTPDPDPKLQQQTQSSNTRPRPKAPTPDPDPKLQQQNQTQGSNTRPKAPTPDLKFQNQTQTSNTRPRPKAPTPDPKLQHQTQSSNTRTRPKAPTPVPKLQHRVTRLPEKFGTVPKFMHVSRIPNPVPHVPKQPSPD
ncbi:hypothetical protein WMY93_012165 [Mugilogobius chulae]|uniref:Uncharacterized protein n=1 Tax=Mugilogobius chulae TaxID=88201 RepID=A0AAW0PDH9_9GOBI